jgi:cytochrome c5
MRAVTVVLGGVLAAVATAIPQAAPGSSAADGAAVYSAVCARCHATGEYGAPKLGDRVAWQPRLHEGVDHLLDQAIEGLGAMPPRGGMDDLGDAELRAAIVYMLQQAGLEPE